MAVSDAFSAKSTDRGREGAVALSGETRQRDGLSADTVTGLLMEYEQAVRHTYRSADSIASVICMAGDALRQSGHIYYMGFNTFGISGLIDASECPPTYSGRREDVRAFLHGGYATLQNSEGDLAPLGQEVLLKWADFDRIAGPNLGPNDLLVFLLGMATLGRDGHNKACHDVYTTTLLVSLPRPSLLRCAIYHRAGVWSFCVR